MKNLLGSLAVGAIYALFFSVMSGYVFNEKTLYSFAIISAIVYFLVFMQSKISQVENKQDHDDPEEILP